MRRYFIFLTLLTMLIAGNLFAQKPFVFREDFKNNNNSWPVFSDDSSRAFIKGGNYVFEHDRIAGAWTSTRVFFFEPHYDYSIIAKIKRASGAENYGHGIFWGYKDARNNSSFKISSTGYVLITRRVENELTTLLPWTKCSAISAQGYNMLKIEKRNNITAYYINDSLVFEQGTQIPLGDRIGFAIDSKMEINVDYFELEGSTRPAKILQTNMSEFPIENLGPNVNSSGEDVVPVISADGNKLFFLRKNHPGNTGSEHNDDVWVSSWDAQMGGWSLAANIGEPVNNAGHNFVISVSPDGNSLLLSGQYNQDGSEGGRGISISTKTKQGWSIPRDVVIEDYYNNSDFASFCMSADQRVLILGLEREDTYGGRDLYVSFKKADNIWSAPLNMGFDINSFGKEITPFLAADGKTLFFSSNGYEGFGSNDIYMTKRLDNSWTKWSAPVNLGSEINSEQWDAYFTVTAKGDYGYFVSQKNSLGKTDINRIPLSGDFEIGPVVLIKGRVLNKKSNEPLSAEITYYDLNTNEEVGRALSDPETGEYEIVLPFGKSYSFFAIKEGFYSERDFLELTGEGVYTEENVDLLLPPIEVGQTVTLRNIFFEQNKSELTEESFAELDELYRLMEAHENMEILIEGHTEMGRDDALMKLSEDRVKSVKKYLVDKGIKSGRIKGKGYGGTRPVASNGFAHTRKLNRRVEFKVTKY